MLPEPRAADGGRGVRHAGDLLPGPDRPRARPGARHRHGDGAGAPPPHASGADSFPQDVVELIGYLGDAIAGARVRAIPGVGTHVPVWILGSSLFGAQLAAHLGLPYAFASHFAPGDLEPAIEVYRETFRPSAQLRGALPDARLQRLRRRERRRGALPAHPRCSRPSSTCAPASPGPLPRPVDDIERAATIRRARAGRPALCPARSTGVARRRCVAASPPSSSATRRTR